MIETDLLVVGSGAAGFAAALTASHAGLDVLMVEKEPQFGGSTACSAGVIWIPGKGAVVQRDDRRGAGLRRLPGRRRPQVPLLRACPRRPPAPLGATAGQLRRRHPARPAGRRRGRRGRSLRGRLVPVSLRAIRRYGMGTIRPAPPPLGPHLRSGYLLSARSWAELAARIGVDAVSLQETIARFNANAARSEDPDFDKGTDAYHCFNGDPAHGLHPRLAPLEKAPFYAMKPIPGDIGTFVGSRVDAYARVLDGNGAPIRGLYAAGNDMASVMGGTYPGAGITIGPALTFGYIAARHAAGVSA